MNLHMNFLAEIPVSPAELFSFLGCALFGIAAYALIIRIQVDRKKLANILDNLGRNAVA